MDNAKDIESVKFYYEKIIDGLFIREKQFLLENIELQSLLYTMKGYNTCGKSYDPMVCDDEEMLSYAFDLKDGGRHHKFKDYEDEYEILEIMINEIIEDL